MKIFLAGSYVDLYVKHQVPYILQTFYDMRKWDEARVKKLLSSTKMFLLDSGAFTFMNSGKKVDFDSYLTEYIAFINKYDIKYFFELDIEEIVGITKTQELTKRLERETGKQCIPVFHKIRGIEWWKQACKEYKYLAIGSTGFGNSKWTRERPDLLNKMIRYAHANGAIVHGLGYTSLANLNNTTVFFDTVDSTSVTSGARFATVYQFNNGKLKQYNAKGRVKKYIELTEYNIEQWKLMQQYKDR